MRKYLRILIGLLRLLKLYILNFRKLKLHGIKYCVSAGVKIWIHNAGTFDLGEKTWFSDNCIIESSGGKITLGYNNFFNSNCKIVSIESIAIGNNNLFGPNVVIVDHDHNFDNRNELICKQGYKKDKICIGSDVWIGANVTICKGVSIGNHVVVGANSVVTKSLKDPGVYAGSPAKKIKKL